MDSQSHIDFARRLLPQSVNHAAIACLFPQIDRQPATLHRNYAHHLNKAKRLTAKGILTFQGPTTETDYEAKRFREEQPRILKYYPAHAMPSVVTDEFEAAALLSFVSHLHLDTFNQPVQAFIPYKSDVSGQFQLWDKIGDFRYRLYVDGVVEELRKDWLNSAIWKDVFTVQDMTVAMVHRLGDLAKLNDQPKLVKMALNDLGLGSRELNLTAMRWLQEMEFELCELHLRHLG